MVNAAAKNASKEMRMVFMFIELESDSDGEVGTESVPHVNAGRACVEVVFAESVFAAWIGKVPFAIRIVVLRVAEVDGVQNVEGAQTEIDVCSFEIDIVSSVQIKQAVTRDLPGLSPFIFAIEAERIEVRKVAAEECESRLQVDLFVAVLQRHAVLSLWRISYSNAFRIVLHNGRIAFLIDVR